MASVFCCTLLTFSSFHSPGFYCPAGSSAPTPCPAGTYGSTAGLSTAACSGLCPCCAAGASAADDCSFVYGNLVVLIAQTTVASATQSAVTLVELTAGSGAPVQNLTVLAGVANLPGTVTNGKLLLSRDGGEWGARTGAARFFPHRLPPPLSRWLQAGCRTLATRRARPTPS